MRVFFKDARTYRFDRRRISQLLASCATSMVQKASFFLYKIFDQKIFSEIFDLKNFYKKNHQIFEQFFIKKNLTCYATVDFKFFHEFKAWEPNVVRPCCREAAALRGASHAKQPHKIFNLKFSEMGHNVIQGTPAPGSTQAKCDSCQGFY